MWFWVTPKNGVQRMNSKTCSNDQLNKPANKARLGNPYQPVVSSAFFRNFNINHRFDARPRW
jgi:hypothetical protein